MGTIGNLTVDILAKRIDDLRASGKSGLVAYCPFDNTGDGDEYYWEDHISVLYFHELDTVYCGLPFYDEYCDIKNRKTWEKYLNDFIEWGNGAECAVENPDEYLATMYDSIIWEMTHDSSECPDLDGDDYDEKYKSYDPECIINQKAYDSFRLCGGETVGQDILAFKAKLESGEPFTVAGKNGQVYEFCLERDDQAKEYSDYDTVFGLGHYVDEIYQDETDGPIPVQVCHRLLHTTEFNTLYAKSKTFIFLNFVS